MSVCVCACGGRGGGARIGVSECGGGRRGEEQRG